MRLVERPRGHATGAARSMVAHALAAHLGARHLDATALNNNYALVADALVLAAEHSQSLVGPKIFS